ncbi:PQQ-dependent sugar dehydrogenase [Variovorax sp.]|uniref:PQQ-dependent sugar dehydrogenase n=1 Tax=Variovorax sp. TaxID=1871043 RepID=UPI002D6DDCD1|nr:PQQ-dependent sugar dehydrogenase [Variovorax sp.]HYP84501.1 PQQ-dependent sugar dehydrogenase [Variovorax sp.]
MRATGTGIDWRGCALALMLAALAAGCGGGGNGADAGATGAVPTGTVAPDDPGDTPPAPPPAAPDSPAPERAVRVVELAKDLNSPWSLAFLPDGRMLVTERAGRLRLRNADGSPANGGADEICCLPAVDAAGQGGLLDVVLDPAFAANGRIYFSFSEAAGGLNGTAVGRAVVDLASRRLSGVTVIYRQQPKVAGSTGHYGSRLVFDRQGMLFVTMGERQIDSQNVYAQDLTRGNGKVVRITTDGAPAPGNPGFGVSGAQPEIWSYGHRNPQGAALHPDTGELWASEHGPQGGDEVNRVLPGRNYGWPVISWGQYYGTTTAWGEGTAKAGMEQPVTYWETIDGAPWVPGSAKSSIAPSGMAFYTADAIAQWKGNLFVGALAGTALWRLVLEGNAVVSRQRLLAERGERIRDVRQGPDGWLYLLTDGAGGKLLRLRTD